MVEQRFKVGAKPALLALVMVVFGASGAVLAFAGASGREVRLWPLPVYTTGGPVYGLAVLSFAFVFAMIALIVRGRSLGLRELVITDAYLEAPRSPWTRQTLRIERGTVRSSRETETMGTRVVVIETATDKLALSNRMVGHDGYAAAIQWLRGRD